MKKELGSMKPGSEVFHEHYGVYGKVMSDKPFVICGELCIRVDFGECLTVEHIAVYVL